LEGVDVCYQGEFGWGLATAMFWCVPLVWCLFRSGKFTFSWRSESSASICCHEACLWGNMLPRVCFFFMQQE
jgi:hypothetical protein